MTRDRNKGNDAIDRLLRSAAVGAEPGQGVCLDAETVAAWADGSLRGDALLLARVHTADCARCQALLGALAQVTPAAPVRDPLWARWRLQWLVPAAAAATAIAIYVAVPGQRSAEQLLSEAEAGTSAQSGQTPPSSSARERPSASLRDAAPSEAPESKAASKPDPPPAKALDALTSASADKAAPPRDARMLNEEVTVAPLPARADEARARQETDAAAAAKRAAPPAPVAGTGATAAPVGGAPSAPAAPAAAPPDPATLSRTAERSQTAAFARAPVEVISPSPAIRWRAVAPGTIQSSSDGGATWTASRDGGTEVLTAGASPSASVCWFVGRAGVVLVTSDNRQWNRRQLPGGADLVSVQATDALAATVTATGGRVYRTTDGGQTWR